jgi:threonine dehydratase
LGGSFKLRGALNKIKEIARQNKSVVAVSGGNHGIAVGLAAAKFGIDAVVVVPSFVSEYRINQIKSTGATVEKVDADQMEKLNAYAQKFVETDEYVYAHPFDDETVIAGQGTVALEFMEQVNNLDMIICSVGGGGLISGIANYAKEANPELEIIGVETEGSNSMSESISNGEITDIGKISSVATSLGATSPSPRTFKIVKEKVDNLVEVSDKAAISELVTLLEREKLLTEPATSCCLAALSKLDQDQIKNKKIGIVICGGNQNIDQLCEFIESTD